MAKKLADTLHNGKVRYGNVKVPLNGDTTRLAQLLKRLAPLLANLGKVSKRMSASQQTAEMAGVGQGSGKSRHAERRVDRRCLQ